MSMPQVDFSSDDMFILGNIASLATRIGLGEGAQSLWKLVQEVRPENAGGFVIEAMYRFATGDLTAGIELLETSGSFDAEINRDEALAFHLFLLQQDGQLERAHRLGGTYLDEDLLQSEAALEAVQVVVSECAEALGIKDEDSVGAGAEEGRSIQ
ncbi:hypothetical protein HW532_17395 [Kaustia mangrovi]|uniref:Tetratricopeptide repeat protein n=1 Tax=Kaustia mangrovi TaxID=2593653 RepID=A0A7S8C6N8_9HYPH|nr:hypothetical protein [Kaustia mangrovi]QPC44316.1 hypothetical protein HW532_17395 [Kaustia mangrovi]